MATTTNFGWDTPDDTDYVTDGAAAMRELGQDIDTTLVDLKGGTTGQILSKASNTDMDFTWASPNPGDITAVTAGTGISGGGTSGDVTITNSMATAIDAKGDLIAGTGADAFSRLAVGNNGETLVADSSTSTGLRYTAGTVQANPVLNSAFQVWQRGTSMAAGTTTFCADRWGNFRGVSGSTFSRQATSDTTNLPNIQYCVRAQRDSGNTSTSTIYLLQDFESINSIPFAGKTVTLSFYARAGANYSATSSALVTNLYTGTGTDQSLRSGYTGSATPISQTTTLTTTWQRFTYTGTIATTATQIGLRFDFTPVGTAGVNDYFEMTGVQIDIGSVALPFRTTTGTIQGELAACQRYFYAVPNGNGKVISNAFAYAASEVDTVLNFPVQMRTTPTLGGTGGTNFFGFFRNGGEDDFDGFTLAGESTAGGAWIYNNAQISGTAGQAGLVRFKNASASLTFSAEL